MNLIIRHRVVAVYILSLIWLLVDTAVFSLHAQRDARNVMLVGGVVVGVFIVYCGTLGFMRKIWKPDLDAVEPATGQISSKRYILLAILCGIYCLIAIAHFAMLGYVPILEALSGTTDVAVSVVRQQGYLDLPVAMRYASDYSAKAVGPALLLVTYYFRVRLFWFVLAVGVFYSLALFARILPVILLAPLLVHLVLTRRWLHAAGTFALLCAMLVASTAVASITIRQSFTLPAYAEKVEVDETVSQTYQSAPRPIIEDEEDWRRTSVIYALYERAIFVPGQVIDQWFYYYAEPHRWERGCGYRVLARLIGCNYVPVPTKLYKAFYKDKVDQGMRGSLNAASFMTDYANFGPMGLVLSSIAGGTLFAFIVGIYRNHPFALPMNLPLIVVSMESSLLTAINSGAGWIAMTAIFLAFFRFGKK